MNKINLRSLLTIAACLIGFQVLGVTSAYAQSLKWSETGLTWTAATVCADGSPATDCPITAFRIETAASATATNWTPVASVAPTVLSYKVGGLTAGPHCFRLIATAVGDSAPSNAPCKTNVAPRPGAPIVSDPLAYEYRPGTNTFARVGLVPVGAPCGPETRTDATGVAYCRLDLSQADLVVWPTNLKLTEVWAKAG